MSEIAKNQGSVPEEYLTIAELALRLKVTQKTIKNKMASGIFKKGLHFFSPKGLGPRFKWSAIVAWLEDSEGTCEREDSVEIPMARGYALKEPLNGSAHRATRQ